MKKIYIFFTLVFFASTSFATVIKDFSVSGTQRMDERAVVQMLGVKIGDDIKTSDLNSGLSALYRTGYFKDISIDIRGSTLFVEITENPVLNRISFEGNDEIDNETLQNEVGFKARQPYSAAKVQAAVDRVLELYKRSGLFSVEIEPKIIERDAGRVDLVFEIDENDKTYILDIDIAGNESFSDSELEGVLLSREKRWWRFLSSFDTYDEDRIEYDKQLLRRHYMSNGFIDFKITQFEAGLTPDRSGYFMNIVVEEGERYKFGKFSIDNPLVDVSSVDLEDEIELEEGEWYSINALDKMKMH